MNYRAPQNSDEARIRTYCRSCQSHAQRVHRYVIVLISRNFYWLLPVNHKVSVDVSSRLSSDKRENHSLVLVYVRGPAYLRVSRALLSNVVTTGHTWLWSSWNVTSLTWALMLSIKHTPDLLDSVEKKKVISLSDMH